MDRSRWLRGLVGVELTVLVLPLERWEVAETGVEPVLRGSRRVVNVDQPRLPRWRVVAWWRRLQQVWCMSRLTLWLGER